MKYEFSKEFRDIIKDEGGKIVLCVLDGLGGIPGENGKTELEVAKTPNLDKLAKESSKGMHIPVEFGITPGSGPSHLALFGYDPVKNIIKRGIMEALGIGLAPSEKEVVARGNFAKCVEENGRIKVIDRRAGRIPTEVNEKLCSLLSQKIKEVDGVKIKFFTVKEHRVCISFEGEGLSDEITDTDPQKEGEYIKLSEPTEESAESQKLADVVNKLTRKIYETLRENEFAQCIIMRGFSKTPEIEKFQDKWKLKALAIASYPMYRGIAKILGMDVADMKKGGLDEQLNILKREFQNYDFFYFHFKRTDSAGEDGDFSSKVQAIEEFDRIIPEILKLSPDVIAITGDHSTPSRMAYHSFHPVPLLVHSERCFSDGRGRFTERDCMSGSIGLIYATDLMPILLANAGRLEKFGA